jgi:hypothetical protein
MTIFSILLLALSYAATYKIPLASISKVTSTYGTPLGVRAIPFISNFPNK